MDVKTAKALVKNLIDVAYEAGMQHNSTMIWNTQNNAMNIGDEIVRHLTHKPTGQDNDPKTQQIQKGQTAPQANEIPGPARADRACFT